MAKLERLPSASEAELAYQPESDRPSGSIEAMLPITSTILLGALLAAVVPKWALPGAAAFGLVMWWRRRRRAKLPHMLLRVRDGRLEITNRDGGLVLDDALDQLDEVRLDTKMVEKVMESPGAAELRFINATVGPSIPTSRIEIVVRGEALTLTEHYTSNIDATDWLPKIRRFLRTHGWRPLHEREEEPVAERPARKKRARRAKR